MASPEKPQFPIRIVWRDSGEEEIYENEIDLLQNLEDFDFNDLADNDTAAVTDALGRSVNLVVRIYEDLCEYTLA